MLVVGINGSPRKGNSFKLLKMFLKGAKERGYNVKLIDACKLKISPCQECGYCSKEGICRIKDDMTEIKKLLENAKYIALCSPVFFFGVSAQLKALIDRCQPLWVKKYILNTAKPKDERKGFFFSTGGFHKEITFKGGELTVKAFFDSLNVEYTDKIFVSSMEYKNDILQRKDCLKKAYEIGKSLG